MKNSRKHLMGYYDYSEPLALLTDKECGQLYKALCAYAEEGKQPENFTEGQKMAFGFITDDMRNIWQNIKIAPTLKANNIYQESEG